jgi:Big-like domain-containing protein/FG-GAP repeat protein
MPGIRLVDVRAALAALAALGLAGLAALALAIVTHVPAPAASGPATHASSTGLSRLQSLPLQAQSVISSTLGTGSRSFAAQRTASGWGLSGGGVRADFRAGEPTLSLAGGRTLSLSLAGVTAPTSVTARGNRVTLTRPGIREWYAAGPLGVEQGFTLAHRPAGATAQGVTLSLAVNGSVSARVAGADVVNFVGARGAVAARYGGLTAVDAAGRHLPSTLSVVNGRVLIAVNDRGARYPLTIDPLVQQGGTLSPSDPKGSSEFGGSVAISADGNTALIGGPQDQGNGTVNDIGAAWVFVRSGGVWSQQGPKILPNDRAGATSDFGTSVALSADGNTALIGGDFDNAFDGAAWVFTRSGATWSQQGPKLTGAAGSNFGVSVALSSDGSTALIGATQGGTAGSAYVFTRSASTWAPQGPVLTPSDAVGNAGFGEAVALSGDGKTALIGGHFDNSTTGAAWIFTPTGSTWIERAKIVPGDEDPSPGSFAPPAAAFGEAVDLSSDGTTALIGGPQNAGGEGAAWVYTGSGTTWNEQRKLTPNGVTDSLSALGSSVALSADGNTAAAGASNDSSGVGAVLVFTRSGTAWSANGSRFAPTGESNPIDFGNSVALAADGQTLLIGARFDGSHGAAFVFAPPNPVCSSVAATTAIGGGAVGVTLSCTFPAGARPNFAIASNPSHGTLSGLNAATGQLTYTSQGGFAGQDSFSYQASDQWGASLNTVAAIVNVPGLPVPKCSNVTAKGKKGATKVTITLKCSGPAGHSFSYGIVSQPGNGKLGTINQSNGKVTYTTHVGTSGTDRFVYNATNAGGSSKAATGTIVLPKLGRITSTMTWPQDFGAGATSTSIPDLLLKNVPGGATVKLSCSKGCPIKSRTLALAKQRACKGKGKKRKCKLVVPKSGNIDLGRYVFHKRVKVGGKITVAVFQSGSIGREFVFHMLKSDQPSLKILGLAPGSTKLCPDC